MCGVSNSILCELRLHKIYISCFPLLFVELQCHSIKGEALVGVSLHLDLCSPYLFYL